jgi:murein tripeptide amidase MpaA
MTINRLDLQSMISPGMSAAVQIYEDADYRSLFATQAISNENQETISVPDKVAALEDKLMHLVVLSSNPERYLDTLTANLNRSRLAREDKAVAIEALNRVKNRLASAGK